MSKHPQRRELTRGQRRSIRREIAKFKKTEVVSDYLAKYAARYDWVRYEAFPALRPPESFMSRHYDFITFDDMVSQ